MTITHAGAVACRRQDGHIQFLVVTSSDGAHWVLPKGHIEAKETAEAAALRELREEAGVIGEIIGPLSVHRYRRLHEEVVVQYYLVRALKFQEADETRLVRWETEERAFELLTFEDARRTLREAAVALKDIN